MVELDWSIDAHSISIGGTAQTPHHDSRVCSTGGQTEVHLTYDKMASRFAPYGSTKARAVARDLDAKLVNLV